jgi:hypothetical protein
MSSECRYQIVTKFAKWTALSALRSGSPVKSRARIYPLLRDEHFKTLLNNPPNTQESGFDEWHRSSVDRIRRHERDLCVGWATKLVNVYLKTAVYVGGLGPPDLVHDLHPPIDRGLWKGLEKPLKTFPFLREQTHSVQQIKQIVNYEQYIRIINGCRQLAKELQCLPIEIEQFWTGADELVESIPNGAD